MLTGDAKRRYNREHYKRNKFVPAPGGLADRMANTPRTRDDGNRYVNKAEKVEKVAKPVKFIALDGEGLGDDREHRYVLLQSSEGDVIQDYNGLSTEQCLNFLCDVEKRAKVMYPLHRCIFVFFAFGYDINMMLRDLSYNAARRLHVTKNLRWKNTYVLQYIPKKSMNISRYSVGDVPYYKAASDDTKRRKIGEIMIWDAFSFFQGSFLKSLKENFDEQELEKLGYDKIAEGKGRRSQFTQEELDSGYISSYTKLEVEALVALMDRINNYCLHLGISLKRYDGAGAVASAYLEKYKILRYYPKQEDIPQGLMQASCHGFGGGHAELFKYGHLMRSETKKKINLWGADRRSSYPSAMIELVNLARGKWVYLEGEQINFNYPMSIYLTKWDFSANPMPFYPFFYRDMNYSITYPMRGYNWIWYPEMQAARKHNPHECMEIQAQWCFIPDDPTERPYAFVNDLYKQREKYKKEGNGVQMVLKLGYNSFYGKTVQKIGYNNKAPKYFQLQYGGWITSHTRGSMYDAMMENPHDVIGIATDGFWSTKKHKLDYGTGLGQWELKELHGGTFVQSGVYWVYNSETKKTHYSRGLEKEALDENEIRAIWEFLFMEQQKHPNMKKDISMTMEATRFVTLGSGITSEERYNNIWHTWHKGFRRLSLYADMSNNKRLRLYSRDNLILPSFLLVKTKPGDIAGSALGYFNNVISKAYPLPWDVDAVKERKKIEYIRELDRLIQEEIELSSY